MYSVYLLNDNGQGSYLSVFDRTGWKTKSVAIKHGKSIANLVNNGKTWQHIAAVWIEDEFGNIVKEFGINRLFGG